ncbi:MAG: lysophospholipid acyltransferase family protein [Deltaproteobacteria bacterium]|nr:lysophospholipid acyltransferase family protein [Deltaproteobacteria bacterium]
MSEHAGCQGRLIRLILSCFRTVPVRLRIRISVGLFLAFYHLSPRRRLIAVHNLKRAFPEKSMAEIVLIAKGAYRNMAITAAEFFDMPYLTKDNIHELVEVEGIEHCNNAIKKNRGLLVFSAHFGNWELQAIAFSLIFQPMLVIYRILDNLFLERFVTEIRSSTGNRLLTKQKAMRTMLKALNANEVVGLLMDQNWSWQEGVFVDFFGRPACTTDGLALLAMHTGAPVIPGFMFRMENGKYRLVMGEEVKIINTGQKEKDVQANTQNFTRIIEDIVRKYPDQWFWVHQRWKTQSPHRDIDEGFA